MQKQLFIKIFLIAFLIFTGCSSTEVRRIPENADVTLSGGDGKVGTYISSWKGFRTSSYWIEGPTGLVLIDAQFLPSAAEEMVEWAEKITGKKVVLAIVLHSNPDKFNGTATFQKRGIKVITSAQVLNEIPAVHELRTGWFYEKFKPDYPVETPTPESFGNSTREISAAGLNLKLHVLGPGCSKAHVVVQHEDHVFVGDLVTIGFHSWLELGFLNEWLKRLDEITGLSPKFVHTGRGGTGDGDSLVREMEYLKTVKALVKKHRAASGKKFTETVSKKITSEMMSRYPSYEYPKFVANGLKATWENFN